MTDPSIRVAFASFSFSRLIRAPIRVTTLSVQVHRRRIRARRNGGPWERQIRDNSREIDLVPRDVLFTASSRDCRGMEIPHAG